jgi:hypothetical protein
MPHGFDAGLRAHHPEVGSARAQALDRHSGADIWLVLAVDPQFRELRIADLAGTFRRTTVSL